MRVEIVRVVARLDGLGEVDVDVLAGVERADDAPRDGERMHVVGGVVVGDAGLPGMDVGAAEILGRDHLAGRRLHERRAAEEDGALPAAR